MSNFIATQGIIILAMLILAWIDEAADPGMRRLRYERRREREKARRAAKTAPYTIGDFISSIVFMSAFLGLYLTFALIDRSVGGTLVILLIGAWVGRCLWRHRPIGWHRLVPTTITGTQARP